MCFEGWGLFFENAEKRKYAIFQWRGRGRNGEKLLGLLHIWFGGDAWLCQMLCVLLSYLC